MYSIGVFTPRDTIRTLALFVPLIVVTITATLWACAELTWRINEYLFRRSSER
jgi:hypothetical protein